MAKAPLVVMTRAKGARGWTVRVDPTSVRVDDTLITSRENGRFRVRRDGARTTDVVLGEPFSIGALEAVCFRADESRAAPTPKVMKAIEAVRAGDSEDARRVLCDVLEESGAVAEAEYVRLELELHRAKDVGSDSFIASVKQLRALSSVVGPTFRYLVGRDIDGCSGVRWAFRCPASWDSMQRTAQESERVCMSCRQLVVQVTNEVDAATLASQGVCAQVRVQDPDEQWVGEVAAPEPEPEPGAPPTWVGSVAVRPPPSPPSVPAPAPRPTPAPPKKPWWRTLFGR